jgi:GT2 family glycosyltransferase
VSKPLVTVAIVSWNTRDLLARALDSLHPEVRAGRAEVWVVDNASADGSPDLVRERYPWVHLVASEENLGFGRAINLVAGRTESEWIATANADIALHPGALETMLAAGERDPEAGAIAPRLLLPSGDTQHSVFAFPTVPFSAILATGVYKLSRTLGDRLAFVGHWDTERDRRVPWAVAAWLLVRRAAWEEVGGFDERQWMYAEDLDLGWRLAMAGRPTRYVPAAHVEHESAASTTQLFGPELAPHWQRATYGCLARRRGVARTKAVAALNAVGAALRWAKVLPRSLRDPGRFAALRQAHWRWVLVHVDAVRASGAELKALR